MSNDPMYAITMAAANLKVVAPEQFEALVSAFRLLETKCRDELLTVSGESLVYNVQGRAWLATMLVSRFANCHEQKRNYDNRA